MPNCSASPARPASVSLTARVRGSRATHSSSNIRAASAAPSAPGEVVVLLAPVHAVADRRARSGERAVDVDAQIAQPPRAVVGEAVVEVAADGRRAVGPRAPALVAAVAADQHAVVDEAGHQRHPEPAGQVVVARARRADGVRAGALAQRAHRRRRGDAGQRLEGPGDVGPGEAEVAMAPVALGDHEAAVDELLQVHARGRGRDAGLRGQHAGGQLAAVGQRAQHARAARIAVRLRLSGGPERYG